MPILMVICVERYSIKRFLILLLFCNTSNVILFDTGYALTLIHILGSYSIIFNSSIIIAVFSLPLNNGYSMILFGSLSIFTQGFQLTNNKFSFIEYLLEIVALSVR